MENHSQESACSHSQEDSHNQSHNHSREGACHHHHVDVEDTSGSRLLITLALNLLIPLVQVIGGLYANSVALISDATHNFSDFTAVLIAYFAYIIGKKGATPRNTFGYRRSEVVAAMINVMILLGASIFILHEAIARFRNPEPVSGILVMAIAGVGVFGNGLSAFLLHKDAAHSLNVRGAFLHMIGDFLTSVAVLLNGLVLIFKPWYWLDPMLSFLIVIFILKNCWTIAKEAAPILMNATPKGIDIEEVQRFLEERPDICGAHHLHAWNVSSISIAFSAHVVVDDQLLSRTETLAQKIREELLHRFDIDHAVLQFETRDCGEGDLLCEYSCSGVRKAH